ncbi:hypothetical protein [Clostridium sporogenes]|nr:hypothetical protein [Clostridium sporogenes]
MVKRNVLSNEMLTFDKEIDIKRKRIFMPSIDNCDGYKKCSYKVGECKR